MKNDQKKALNSDRRNFIPGAVVAADSDSPGQPKAQKGYRLTAHILEYYKSTAS
jgi:hypothetical protein